MIINMTSLTWTVMCRQPAILAPFNGLEGPYFCLRNLREIKEETNLVVMVDNDDDDNDDDDSFNEYIHEPRHLLLCQRDRLAAPVGQGDVGHLVRNLPEKKLNSALKKKHVFEKQLHQQQNKMEMSSVVKSNKILPLAIKLCFEANNGSN